MRLTFTHYADEHERFSPAAFDGSVGREITVNHEDRRMTGVLVSAEVANDLRSVSLCVDVPELGAPRTEEAKT